MADKLGKLLTQEDILRKRIDELQTELKALSEKRKLEEEKELLNTFKKNGLNGWSLHELLNAMKSGAVTGEDMITLSAQRIKEMEERKAAGNNESLENGTDSAEKEQEVEKNEE